MAISIPPSTSTHLGTIIILPCIMIPIFGAELLTQMMGQRIASCTSILTQTMKFIIFLFTGHYEIIIFGVTTIIVKILQDHQQLVGPTIGEFVQTFKANKEFSASIAETTFVIIP